MRGVAGAKSQQDKEIEFSLLTVSDGGLRGQCGVVVKPRNRRSLRSHLCGFMRISYFCFRPCNVLSDGAVMG